jgi:3-deoxy-D-manno-octulosonic acid kinase
VRAFAEWRLLRQLIGRNLPVPTPVAARYQRRGLTYRCDLITQRIVDAEALSALLARGAIEDRVWREVGVAIARLHAAGADHADLNAHNILLGRAGVSIIDFDRGRLRAPGAWQAHNLARLRRSLVKLQRYQEREWQSLLEGYASI